MRHQSWPCVSLLHISPRHSGAGILHPVVYGHVSLKLKHANSPSPAPTQLELHLLGNRIKGCERDRMRVLINKAGLMMSIKSQEKSVYKANCGQYRMMSYGDLDNAHLILVRKVALFMVSLLDSFCILHLIKCAAGY